MNRKKVVSFMLALSLAAVPIALAGCGSGGGLIATQSPEEALESAEITWNGYTMGIDCVTADQERMAGSELSGQGIRTHTAECTYQICNRTGTVSTDRAVQINRLILFEPCNHLLDALNTLGGIGKCCDTAVISAVNINNRNIITQI